MLHLRKILCFLAGLVLIVGISKSIKIDRNSHVSFDEEEESDEEDDLYSSRTQGGISIREDEFPFFVRALRYHSYPRKPIRYELPRKHDEESGGIIINNRQVLVPASFTKNQSSFIMSPYITYPARSSEKFKSTRFCISSKFREFVVGEPPINKASHEIKGLIEEKVALPPERPSIYDLAVLELEEELDFSNPTLQYREACLGKAPVRVGETVTVVSVGRDNRGKRNKQPTKLTAKVTTCPDLLEKENVFCLDAHYICQSDRGAAVVKNDGCVYGIVTYSYDCNPVESRIAVRAMDLVRLRHELANVTRECYYYAKPLGFSCPGDLIANWDKFWNFG